MAEATGSATRVVEFIDDLKLDLLDGHKHHLRYALSRLYLVRL